MVFHLSSQTLILKSMRAGGTDNQADLENLAEWVEEIEEVPVNHGLPEAVNRHLEYSEE